jgi:hypothetical protein
VTCCRVLFRAVPRAVDTPCDSPYTRRNRDGGQSAIRPDTMVVLVMIRANAAPIL